MTKLDNVAWGHKWYLNYELKYLNFTNLWVFPHIKGKSVPILKLKSQSQSLSPSLTSIFFFFFWFFHRLPLSTMTSLLLPDFLRKKNHILVQHQNTKKWQTLFIYNYYQRYYISTENLCFYWFKVENAVSNWGRFIRSIVITTTNWVDQEIQDDNEDSGQKPHF